MSPAQRPGASKTGRNWILIATDEDRPRVPINFVPFALQTFCFVRPESNKQSKILGAPATVYISGARVARTFLQEWSTMSDTDLTYLKHPDKVAQVIRLAVAEQKSDDILYCRAECRTDLVFRYHAC